MTKLPQLKPKEVAKALKSLGFEHKRTTGSHARFIHPADKRRKTTVPMYRHPLPKPTLKSILRQAGITTEELLENL
mgnify:CR=1 FL=1